MEELDRDTIRARLKQFLVELIDERGPKAVARDLSGMGWPYQEGTVRTWRGAKNPPPDVVFALAARYGESMDAYAMGKALEAKFTDQVAEQGEQLRELVDRFEQLAANLHGYEAEIARHLGEPRPAMENVGEVLGLTVATLRKQVPAAEVGRDRESLPHSQEA